MVKLLVTVMLKRLLILQIFNMLIILNLLKMKPQILKGAVYGQTAEATVGIVAKAVAMSMVTVGAVTVIDVVENVLKVNPAAIVVFPVIKNVTNHQDVHVGDSDCHVPGLRFVILRGAKIFKVRRCDFHNNQFSPPMPGQTDYSLNCM